ncbi:MAG: hypothetical protein KAS93_07850 [Gammaproteobacteria bacterium]|nr:hypothetical protein [Gammaproteobacteria bacterium]
MAIFTAFLLIFIAGTVNGSFALPTKYVFRWNFENIWLQYALWAFVILPWVIALILVPQIFTIYREAPVHILLIILIGGLAFGVGQVCFALAMRMIGIGLGFVINLGLGIMLGFLLPLVFQHPDQILQPFGLITLFGTILAVFGLLFSNMAGSLHDRQRKGLVAPTEKHDKTYAIGVMLAIIAGVSSSGQNFAFSLTGQLQQFALHLGANPVGAANIMWPGFLLCSFIPYATYMLYLTVKNKSFHNYAAKSTGKYYLFAFIMGLFWYGSLIAYSKATHIIGVLGPLVGWPLFMVLIILTSNFWGWRHHEWAGCSKRVKYTLWVGLLFLIASVIVLGYSSVLHT